MERLKQILAKLKRMVIAAMLVVVLLLGPFFLSVIVWDILADGPIVKYEVRGLYIDLVAANDSPYRWYQRWTGAYLEEDPVAYRTPEQILEMLEPYKAGSKYRLWHEIGDEERASRGEAIKTLIGYMNERDAVADAVSAAAKGDFAIYLLYMTPYEEGVSYMRPPPPVYSNTGVGCTEYEAYKRLEYFIVEEVNEHANGEPPYKTEREFITAFIDYLRRYNRAMFARSDFPYRDSCVLIPEDMHFQDTSDLEVRVKELLSPTP